MFFIAMRFVFLAFIVAGFLAPSIMLVLELVNFSLEHLTFISHMNVVETMAKTELFLSLTRCVSFKFVPISRLIKFTRTFFEVPPTRSFNLCLSF